MKRYIDGDFTIKELYKKYKNAKGEARKAYSDAIDIVTAQGDEDVQEVKHGNWLDTYVVVEKEVQHHYENFKEYRVICSHCSSLFAVKSFYCPNCGARMDGEENAGT